MKLRAKNSQPKGNLALCKIHTLRCIEPCLDQTVIHVCLQICKLSIAHCSNHHLPQWSVWCFCSVCSSAFNGSIAGAWVFGRFFTHSLCSAYLNSQIQPNPFYHSSNLVHPCRRNWKRPMLGCLQPCRRRLAAALQCM